MQPMTQPEVRDGDFVTVSRLRDREYDPVGFISFSEGHLSPVGYEEANQRSLESLIKSRIMLKDGTRITPDDPREWLRYAERLSSSYVTISELIQHPPEGGDM